MNAATRLSEDDQRELSRILRVIHARTAERLRREQEAKATAKGGGSDG